MKNIILKIFIIALFVFNIPPFGGAWSGFLLDGSLLHAQWKAYLSYYEPTEIERAGDGTIYVLASGGVYSYNPNDQQLTTYDKTTVLNDCGIAHIAWCQAARRLVILYDDYNIDLLSPNGNVVNMPSYMNTSMTDDKTIYGIDVSGNYAYLSTGFGVVQLNVADASFTNTYRLGFRVDYSYTDGGYLYAASNTNGLYRGLMTDNLLDPSQWTRVGNFTARPKTMDPTLLATVNALNIDGPKYNNFGYMKMYQNKLYTVAGGYKGLAEMNRPGYIQILDNNNNWTLIGDSIAKITGHAFVDLTSIDIDPRNSNHFFASGRTGLYEFLNNSFVGEYTPDNSPLRGARSVSPTSKDYNMVLGITYNRNGNLWALNSNTASTSIFEYTTDNEWIDHHNNELMVDGVSLRRMENPFFDSNNLLWAINDYFSPPELFFYQPSSDAVKQFRTFVNEDGTSITLYYVRCLAEDREGNMWIGTDVGPLMLETDQFTSDNPIFTQVKVPRNDGTDLADYLLSNVDITCLSIDNANRKWFGTSSNGVYLISANNIQQIQHFTKENSPLLSNNIESIAINNNTGEVFIGTDHGLCSYTANIPSSDGMTKDNVYAYPNPVRPDYKGAITITGLDEEADVKIVTTSGALVYEGKASGGQYKWYGLDRDGKRVASGVYMVEVATAEGDNGVVCKIAIVN